MENRLDIHVHVHADAHAQKCVYTHAPVHVRTKATYKIDVLLPDLLQADAPVVSHLSSLISTLFLFPTK